MASDWRSAMVQEFIDRREHSLIDFARYETSVQGQEHPSVSRHWQSRAIITAVVASRGNHYRRVDRAQLLIPADQEAPKLGDTTTLPSGKEYQVDSIEFVRPFGDDLYYDVGLADG